MLCLKATLETLALLPWTAIPQALEEVLCSLTMVIRIMEYLKSAFSLIFDVRLSSTFWKVLLQLSSLINVSNILRVILSYCITVLLIIYNFVRKFKFCVFVRFNYVVLCISKGNCKRTILYLVVHFISVFNCRN